MFSLKSSSTLLQYFSSLSRSTASSGYISGLGRTKGLARNFATPVTPQRFIAPTEDNSPSLDASEVVFKTYKPVTPGLRHLRRPINKHLWEGRPFRPLTIPLRKKGGRNSHGHITIRFRGGGHKQRIRTVDFMRMENTEYDVIRIEYDPGRSAHIALLRSRDPNADGLQRWKYIVACEGMRGGDVVQSFRTGVPDGLVPGFVDSKARRGTAVATEGSETNSTEDDASAASLAIGLLRAKTIRPGNVLPLRLIPPGTVIHCISLKPDGKALLVRSAGSWAQIVLHDDAGRYSHVKLQSGEIRKILQDCCATIGRVSNPLWKGRMLGKAGRNRWLGWRPRVRGVAMNANDHPHGGGRGKSKSNKHPVSIWGWATKGKRTRKPGPRGPKNNNKMVIRERPRGKEKQGRIVSY